MVHMTPVSREEMCCHLNLSRNSVSGQMDPWTSERLQGPWKRMLGAVLSPCDVSLVASSS